MIIKKNSAGLSALDYATMANNAKIAAFLAEMFYIFGQDLLCKDNQVIFKLHKKKKKIAPQKTKQKIYSHHEKFAEVLWK